MSKSTPRQKLKRCPICKNKAEVRENVLYYSNAYKVICTSCYVQTPNFSMLNDTDYEAIDRAINCWNKRRILPWPKRIK